LHAQDAAAPAADAAQPSQSDLEARLRIACEQRMRQLEAAQQDNLAAMQWQQDAIGMRGEYVGYSPEYDCTLSPPASAVPVGRMKYREISFEKRGDSVSDAMQASPEPQHIEEVTQVFVYRDGSWK
jgi:hypothetical protein